MKLIRGYKELDEPIEKAVVTVGNFDGVHLGHQHIISVALEKAKEINGKSVLYTFRPHPHLALRPELGIRLLTTYDEKISLIEKMNIDYFVEEPFHRNFSTTEPSRFFYDVLIKKFNAKVIVVGYDFGFGKERAGSLGELERLCKETGVELIIISPQKKEQQVISSTVIRDHLLSCRLKEANSLLGYSFFYRGSVIRGEGRGRQIGFPTANLKLQEKLPLPYGVYATYSLWREKKYLSITNIGVRPTFHESQKNDDRELPALVETHIFDENFNLYGETLEVQFIDFIRAEKRFDGVESLVGQIQKDVSYARTLL